MEIQALTRNARMSPRKVREIANQIQGRSVPEAIDFLTLIPRKSARLLAKTLKSAVKAGAKGSAKPRVKRMSHLRIVLTDGKSN
jgi:large subunit ribosomal protein L22